MTGLIALLVLIPLIFLILLISLSSKSSEQKRLLESLFDELKQLNQRMDGLVPTKKEPYVKPGFQQKMEQQLRVEEEIKTQAWKKDIPPVPEELKPETTIPEIKKESPVPEKPEPVAYPEDQPGWWSRWLQKNPDLEKFIGENLANKIGIAVLVLGIAFFVRYAIDKNWIRELGRVLIGLLSGGVLLGLGHYIRNRYRSFSSVLAGGGIAVLYFTTAFAYHQYNLIGQQSAFIIMVGITIFAVILSLLYERLELAILATLGGFITPFLVATNQENYIALFIYLAILNTGLMALAWFRRWPILTTLALFFTMIIYGGWLTRRLWSDDSFPYQDALLFDTVFYVLFIIMAVINNIRVKRVFSGFDFIVVLTINLLYYVAGMIILGHWNEGAYQGLFTGALGLVNFLLAIVFYRNKNVDRNFISLLIGLTLTFLSFIAPVQWKGNQVTLFWAAEMVILYALFQKTGIRLMKYASAIVGIAMLSNLILDWSAVYFSNGGIIPIMKNKGFVTGIVAAISLLLYSMLLKKEKDAVYVPTVSTRSMATVALILGLLVFYLSGAFEIFYQFHSRAMGTILDTVYLQLYSCCFALLLTTLFHRSTGLGLRFGLTMFCFAMYLSDPGVSRDWFLFHDPKASTTLYLGHWVMIVILLKLFYDLIISFVKDIKARDRFQVSFTWGMAISIVLLLSIEMHQVITWMYDNTVENQVYWENLYSKAGLTILWGICSFAMMWLGMKHRYRMLRIISLTLFTITLGKLFIFDIRNIPPGGKIAAFILLGILLLVVSFMYQRLKRIIIEE